MPTDQEQKVPCKTCGRMHYMEELTVEGHCSAKCEDVKVGDISEET